MLNIIHNYKDNNNSNWILARHPCSCFGPLFPGQFEGLVSKKGAEPEDQEGKKGGARIKINNKPNPQVTLDQGLNQHTVVRGKLSHYHTIQPTVS